MIVFNYTGIIHCFIYWIDGRMNSIITHPGQKIDMVAYPEAGLALIKHNEYYMKRDSE